MAKSNRSFYPRRTFTPRAPRDESPAPAAPTRKPLQIEGEAQLWVTLQRVTDPNSGWVKTTRAMETPGGVLVNTCSRKVGSEVAAEALCYVPAAKLTRTSAGWKVVGS